MTSSSGEGRRQRGRPTVIDPVAVSEAVLDLWWTEGYATTGWREIADVTGISVRTLMRHFPARSDIAWTGVPAATARLAAALEAVPGTTHLGGALRTAVARSVSHDALVRRVAPRWLRLVAREPELAASATAAYRPWTEILAAFVRRHAPDVPDATARAVAAAYQAAAFEALVGWATHGEGDPADAVKQALRWFHVDPPHDGARTPARSSEHDLQETP